MAEDKYKAFPTGLYWKGKKTEVDRIVLPFQTIETINESRTTREREKVKGKDLFDADGEPIPSLQAMESVWHNRLI